ncbi:MAG: molybdopterin dehydrogenase [Proteobacteria bacterium]|nr:MAG: molybdopterin dehydrogenase [Pseudomonadota bacterium]
MKPPRFRYCEARSVDEALALLAEHGDDAKLLAGGQSLIPMLNLRVARPAVLIDVNRIAELQTVETNGALRIGALVRQRRAERSEPVRAGAPLLGQALRFVGHPAIRTRGTIGGSAAHADPAAEIPCVLSALDAEFELRGGAGARVVGASEFFVTTLTTALAPTELLAAIRIPAPSARARSAFLEIARRHGDFAIAAVAVSVELAEGGAIERARICFANLADVPYRAHAAEKALRGARIDDERAVREAAEAAVGDASPASDLHASARDRLDLAKVLLRRALGAIAAGGSA